MKYAQDYHIVPVLAATSATGGGASAFVNASKYQWIDFIINIGTLTGDTMTVTVEECTGNDTTAPATEQTIPFVYRQASAVGTDSLGAATTCVSTGVAIADTDDNTLWVVSVNPASLSAGYNYVRINLTPGSSTSAEVRSACAVMLPRYAQASPLSSS